MSRLPLPVFSFAAMAALAGLALGIALGTSSAQPPVGERGPTNTDPAPVQEGGDGPPMEYAPEPTTTTRPPSSPATARTSRAPVVTTTVSSAYTTTGVVPSRVAADHLPRVPVTGPPVSLPQRPKVTTRD